MAHPKKHKGVIGILTGGGDVPGLNPAIRAVTVRALREGYQVLGIRRGWAGLIEIVREPNADNSEWVKPLTEEVVNRAGRTGGATLDVGTAPAPQMPAPACASKSAYAPAKCWLGTPILRLATMQRQLAVAVPPTSSGDCMCCARRRH